VGQSSKFAQFSYPTFNVIYESWIIRLGNIDCVLQSCLHYNFICGSVTSFVAGIGNLALSEQCIFRQEFSIRWR